MLIVLAGLLGRRLPPWDIAEWQSPANMLIWPLQVEGNAPHQQCSRYRCALSRACNQSATNLQPNLHKCKHMPPQSHFTSSSQQSFQKSNCERRFACALLTTSHCSWNFLNQLSCCRPRARIIPQCARPRLCRHLQKQHARVRLGNRRRATGIHHTVCITQLSITNSFGRYQIDSPFPRRCSVGLSSGSEYLV